MDLKEAKQRYHPRDEINHWWIKCRFYYIEKAISYIEKSRFKVIEFGCGTGQNLYYISNISRFKHNVTGLIGIDPSLKVDKKPKWLHKKGFLAKNDKKLISASFLICMDVIEHIDDDAEALKSWIKKLNKGGYIIISVPAFMHLWSYHDNILEHKRRYTKKQLIDLTTSIGLTPIHVNYIFSFIYPAMMIIRKILKIKKNKMDNFKIPNYFINTFLTYLGKLEYFAGGSKYFGTSIIGIFKK